MSRLREHYEKTVKPTLMKEFGYDNPLQAPRLEKIVVNMGVGEAVQDQKRVEAAAQDLSLIAEAVARSPAEAKESPPKPAAGENRKPGSL
ncbi:MAG: 50S ribosomal protein L5 [Bradyrhizobium sp.]